MRIALAHSMSQQASTSGSQPKVAIKKGEEELGNESSLHSSRSGGHRTVPAEDVTVPMANCGPTGCLVHLQPVNRTGGLLAKTLQKLRFRGFGKSKAAVKYVREPVISAPVVESVERSSFPGFPALGRELVTGFDRPEVERSVSRNNSMPRPMTSHHVRHKSFS